MARTAVLLDALGRLPGCGLADDPDERLMLQKTVYLLDQVCQRQELGDLGYRFGWHHRGPYSSSLDDDLLAIAGRPESGRPARGPFLTHQGRGVVEVVGGLLKIPGGTDIGEVLWHELLASIAYLTRTLNGAGFERSYADLQRTRPGLARASQAWLAWLALNDRHLC